MILLIILDFIFRNGIDVHQAWATHPGLFVLLVIFLA